MTFCHECGILLWNWHFSNDAGIFWHWCWPLQYWYRQFYNNLGIVSISIYAMTLSFFCNYDGILVSMMSFLQLLAFLHWWWHFCNYDGILVSMTTFLQWLWHFSNDVGIFCNYDGIFVSMMTFLQWLLHFCNDAGIFAMMLAFLQWCLHFCYDAGIFAMSISFSPTTLCQFWIQLLNSEDRLSAVSE